MSKSGRPTHASENLLLAALPQAVSERLKPHLERVSLSVRQVVYEPGKPIRKVYFPINSVISLVDIMDDGVTVELATVGREGVAGLPVFLGAQTMPTKAFAQIAGEALGMEAKVCRAEFERGGDFARLLLRYTQAVFNQVGRSAACNRVHSIEERCARWLLMIQDRVGQDHFELTQEFLAQMLGVRRAGVNAAAGALQRAGFITYTRGRITVTDRPGLESSSCECYRVIQAEYQRLLGGPDGPPGRKNTKRNPPLD